METQNLTPDANSNYSVLLGSTTAAGLPSDLFSQQEERWLGVQIQGQPEQPRVLLVSVPYAFRASEAERLAGHSFSEFVTSDTLQSAVQQQLQQQVGTGNAAPAESTTSRSAKPSGLNVPTDPATNFVDSTTDQVVGVTQNGSGKAINASAVQGNAIVGNSTATAGSAAGVEGLSSAPTGFGIMGQNTASTGSSYGIYGLAASTMGIGVQGNASASSGATYGILGYSYSSSGTGIRAGAVAATGSTYGLQAWVNSPTGTAALFQNFSTTTVTGKLLVAKTMATGAQFVVDGSANVTTTGSFTGNGAGLTGILFSQLSGTLASSQFSGTYGNAVTLSNTSNVYYGNGSNLTGVVGGGPGSPYYIQNGTAQQASANFNISGNGTLGGSLTASSVNATNTVAGYQLSGSTVLQAGSLADQNLFLGVSAGANNEPGHGQFNTFAGNLAGRNNSAGTFNTYLGNSAGYQNTTGDYNTLTGGNAGTSNVGQSNTFYGYNAGVNSQSGSNDIYIGSPGCGIYPNACSENNTIRVGGDTGSGSGSQTAAYLAGVYGAATSTGSAVFIDSTGKLGTSGGSVGVVTSFKGRVGAVMPNSNDYSFYRLGGTLGSSQFSGTYSSAVTISNSSNAFRGSFTGNGSGLTGVLPGAGSPNYIQNGTTQQSSANFNISGNGTVGGTLSGGIVNAISTASQPYEIGGNPVLGVSSASGYPDNVFLGVGAGDRSTGEYNTFSGIYAGQRNTGSDNIFMGPYAGTAESGSDNISIGYESGQGSGGGSGNIFLGGLAGGGGSGNIFLGGGASGGGDNNIFIGNAYSSNGNGDNGSDIYIGSTGPYAGAESNVIRIGGTPFTSDPQQSNTYIAGIYQSTVDSHGIPVYVDDNGKLGTLGSSRRFKEQINDIGDKTSALMKLRPVTFFYKPEYDKGERTLQYGLIAEEVAQVYPELVAYDKDGQPYTVKYPFLAPMLLNELQKQHAVVAAQQDVIKTQQEEIKEMQERLSRLETLVGVQVKIAESAAPSAGTQ
ncbi:MAG: tail fiber domain-containing protein [Candidatus Korobacteraceae bacterium]